MVHLLKIALRKQKLKIFNIMRIIWNILTLKRLKKEMHINQRLCLSCAQLEKSAIFRIGYINSCNLEHVLYNELKDFSDDEKEILSDEFAEKYEGKVLEFIDFISDKSVSVEGTYKETWKYIEKDKNSLERHSNMHLIFKTD